MSIQNEINLHGSNVTEKVASRQSRATAIDSAPFGARFISTKKTVLWIGYCFFLFLLRKNDIILVKKNAVTGEVGKDFFMEGL